MSHSKERKEKACLNCGAAIYGRFCHICGQENIETKETFLGLVTHFIEDITHFDGKFFSTLKHLLFRPGFLSLEYLKGKRASYLHPIKMYVFTSAFFFLIVFTFYKNKESKSISNFTINGKTEADVAKMNDSAFAAFTANINKEDDKDSLPMTRKEFETYKEEVLKNKGSNFNFFGRHYKTVEEYDSVQKVSNDKDGWLVRQIVLKNIELNEKYKENPKEFRQKWAERFLHVLPQMFFLSLPLFALLLKLLYIRRKQFYYVNHSIFTLHLYCAIFIIFLFSLWSISLSKFLHLPLKTWITIAAILGGFIYLYKGMRVFYGQRRAKTIFKYLLLLLIWFFVFLFVLMLFIVFSTFTI